MNDETSLRVATLESRLRMVLLANGALLLGVAALIVSSCRTGAAVSLNLSYSEDGCQACVGKQ